VKCSEVINNTASIDSVHKTHKVVDIRIKMYQAASGGLVSRVKHYKP